MDWIYEIWSFMGENVSSIIAACALLVTFWQGWLMRKHNKLSVKPHLDFTVSATAKNPQVLLSISNAGSGTAYVKSYDISLDGKTYDQNNVAGSFELLQGLNINYHYIEVHDVTERGVFPAGSSKDLIKIETFDGDDPHFNPDHIYEQLRRVEIQLVYESVYGDQFEVTYKY